jgi:LCP family protein required for cell wall assembly
MDADVTESDGTPAAPDNATDADAGTPADPSGPPKRTPLALLRRRDWLRSAAFGMSVLMLTAAGVGWSLYQDLEGNIRTDRDTLSELRRYESERPTAMVRGAQNILLIGSDNRGDGNEKYGRDTGTQRSDTTILLHLAANRKSATAVSIPRDLMVDIPVCRKPDGKQTGARFAQFNWAFQFGGAACSIRTVEHLTGIRIDHHIIVDFNGFTRMVDAVKGVEVCLKEPIVDAKTPLELPAGRHVLRGEQALVFVRARYGVGDGSDTERMERQQQFLAALVKKVQSNGVLLNPTRLYPVLDSATSSLTTDPGLDSLRELYEMVRSVRNIPTERVRFLTVPRRPYAYNANRDELVEPEAGQLFARLRHDRDVAVAAPRTDRAADTDTDGGGRSSSDSDSDSDETTEEYLEPMEDDPMTTEDPKNPGAARPSPPPTYRGTTAASNRCE